MSVEFNRGNNTCIPNVGIAYVIIPENCDTVEYIQRCYRNNTLSIGGGMGATAMHNVKVAEGVLDKIKFPNNGSTQGSSVVWIREGFYNKPVIIGAIPEGGKATNLIFNGQQRIYQEAAQRIAEVFLDALSSRVLITALGDLAKPAEIVIKANSRNAEGDVVNVESKDLIKLDGQSLKINLTKDFELTINNGFINEEGEKKDILKIRFDKNELTLLDSHGNKIILDEEHTQFLCNRFDVGNGEEQMVLGNTLVDLLGKLIDAICNLTVVTHEGASGTPLNETTFVNIKSKLNTILSKLSNTD